MTELLFVLFLFAGRFKADPRFAWIPVDVTAALFVLSVASGVVVLLRRGRGPHTRGLLLSLLGLGFVVWAAASLAWSPGGPYARQKALYIATLTYWPVVAAAMVFAPERPRVERLLKLILLFGLWLVVESTLAFVAAGGAGLLQVLGANYLGVGRVVGPAFLIAITYRFLGTTTQVERRMLDLSAVSMFGILLVLGGRGPIIATLAGALPLFMLSGRLAGSFRIKVRRYAAPLGVLAGAGVAAIGLLFATGRVTTTLLRLLILLEPGGGTSAGLRLIRYQASLPMWEQHLFVGNGIGSFPILFSGAEYNDYPHNIVLELLAETGLIGAALFTILVLAALALLGRIRDLRADPLRLLVLMLFLNLGVNAMFSGDIPDNRYLFAMVGLMALTPCAGGLSAPPKEKWR
ncbi:MAG: O-antigen ligase family protein [Gemmatimonadota bacterium]